MVRKLIVVCCMLAGLMGATAALAQDAAKPAKTRPDIPGSFVVEFGFNQPLSVPDTMNLGFWGSRTMNVYYIYDIRILKVNSAFILVSAWAWSVTSSPTTVRWFMPTAKTLWA
ncbi:MAG: hypothetical protein HC859_07825 [Bacteroidia bacterium]|nr:hypothetical protein [Bacteroidia bacterium]